MRPSEYAELLESTRDKVYRLGEALRETQETLSKERHHKPRNPRKAKWADLTPYLVVWYPSGILPEGEDASRPDFDRWDWVIVEQVSGADYSTVEWASVEFSRPSGYVENIPTVYFLRDAYVEVPS